MPESRTVIECPLCRCRMEVPRHEGARAYTCRNGHRFERRPPGARDRALPARRAPSLLVVVLLALLAFVVVYALAGHRWLEAVTFGRHG